VDGREGGRVVVGGWMGGMEGEWWWVDGREGGRVVVGGWMGEREGEWWWVCASERRNISTGHCTHVCVTEQSELTKYVPCVVRLDLKFIIHLHCLM
jgi:hypothetical protein